MPALGLGLLLAAAFVVQDPVDPAAIMRHAAAAVEGDSVDAVERRWRRTLARDSSNRAARLGLASLAHHTSQDSLAELHYRSLLPATPADADALGAYAALGLAQVLASSGAWAEADAMAELAMSTARAVAAPDLLAETLVNYALMLSRTGGPEAAHPVLDEAEAAAPPGSHRIRGLLRCYRAQMYMLVGNGAALDVAIEGAELAAREPHLRTQGACLTVAANELSRRGEADSALSMYGAAIAVHRQARDEGGLAVALQWRSYLHFTLGQLTQARRDAVEAVEHGRVARPNVVPWALSTLAWVAFSLGDGATGAVYAAQSRDAAEQAGDLYFAVNARQLEASMRFAAGDPSRAREAYEAVVRASGEIGWTGVAHEAHVGLMHVALAVGDRERAWRELAAAREAAVASGGPGAFQSHAYHAGVLALLADDPVEAERLFRESAATGLTAQATWRYRVGARLAEALARQGRLAEAEREMRSAADALDEWRSQLDDRDLRLLAFQIAEDRSDPDLGVAGVIAALAAGGRIASAFELVERGRARELADRLNRAAALDTMAVAATRAHRSITLDSLQRALPDDATAVFEYVTGRGDPTTLFVITRDDARTYRLPPHDSLEASVARFTALLEAGAAPRPLAGSIGTALIGQALADLPPGIERLVIVPDGPLHRLPFAALALSDGRFLIERFTISTVPAAEIAATLWQRPPRSPRSHIAVFADPRFATESARARDAGPFFVSALEGPTDLPRLAGSSREADAVVRFAETATLLRRDAATEAWLKREPLEHFSVLHFATHALVDQQLIANTALALAPDEGEDGFVGPADLAKLRLAAELVVLSACRTAGGVVVRGEGVQGLAGPLLEAGARAVAATWWPIGDRETIRIVEDFYRAMAAGQPVGDALRTAKLAALERGAPAREWAAFTIVGDPLALPPLRTPTRSLAPPTTILAAVLLLILLIGILAIRLRAAGRGARTGSATVS